MYRKGVSALIINGKQEFLVVNLKSFEDKYFSIPGGGIEEMVLWFIIETKDPCPSPQNLFRHLPRCN